MKTKILLIAALAMLVALPASARDRHYTGYGYGGYGHGYGYGHRYDRHDRYRYRHGYRHGRRHRSDHRYGYLAAGIIVGAIVNEALDRRREPERVVVYRESAPRQRTIVTAPSVRALEDVYYLRQSDGSCWLIERLRDGSRNETPVPAGDC